jgi:selenocysteine lyase/cysteine desulfurase
MSLASQRHLFDVPRRVAYFNCASSTPQLNAARERLALSVAAKSHPWTRSPRDYFTNAEAIRNLCAQVIGGDPDGYAVVPSASYAIATAARALEPTLAQGDEIVMMAEEFPSLVLAFRRLARERNASIAVVPAPADGDWTRAIGERIGRRTRVVAISSCHWTNGALVDLAAIARACRDASAVLLVDGTQTIGAMPFDLAAIDPDFVAISGYKWMLGQYGVSFFYAAPRWREARPLEEVWLARDGAEDFANLVRPSDRYVAGARRFDMGEKGNALLAGTIAGLEQLRDWTVPEVARSLAGINRSIAQAASELGFEVPPERLRCPHMFGARIPERLKGDPVAALREREIYVSRRGDALRISPHLHVDATDADRLVEALRAIAA